MTTRNKLRVAPQTAAKKTLRSYRSQPVTRAEFNALRTRMEDMEDAMSVIKAQNRGVADDALSSEYVARLVAGEHPLRVWREFRGMTGAELALQAGVSASYLTEVETGKKPGSTDFLKKCAKALGVAVDDLIA